ncbi:MAG TPA: GNAT family protein [Ideonella sp.]|nr:GNAT family protein [Ideonella sp.]
MHYLDWPALLTARCRLRPFREGDLPVFAAYRADPAVAALQSWDTGYALADAQRLWRGMCAEPFGQVGQWVQIALAGRDDDRLLGDFALHFIDEQQVEIGFSLAPAQQGQGLALEGLRALLGHLFGERACHRVIAVTDVRNTAAAKLLRRAGFREEGCQREATWFKGAWCDEWLFAMLAGEWPGAAGGPLPAG